MENLIDEIHFCDLKQRKGEKREGLMSLEEECSCLPGRTPHTSTTTASGVSYTLSVAEGAALRTAFHLA